MYARPITIGMLAVSSGVNRARFAAQLAQQLSAVGRVEVIDSDTVERELRAPEATPGPQAQADVNRRIAMLLDRIEARAEFVLLVADSGPSAWTARCCRDADELLLLRYRHAHVRPPFGEIERSVSPARGARQPVASPGSPVLIRRREPSKPRTQGGRIPEGMWPTEDDGMRSVRSRAKGCRASRRDH